MPKITPEQRADLRSHMEKCGLTGGRAKSHQGQIMWLQRCGMSVASALCDPRVVTDYAKRQEEERLARRQHRVGLRGGRRAARKPKERAMQPICEDKCQARVWEGGYGGQCTRKHREDGCLCTLHAREQAAGGWWLGLVCTPRPSNPIHPNGTVHKWRGRERYSYTRAVNREPYRSAADAKREIPAQQKKEELDEKVVK